MHSVAYGVHCSVVCECWRCCALVQGIFCVVGVVPYFKSVAVCVVPAVVSVVRDLSWCRFVEIGDIRDSTLSTAGALCTAEGAAKFWNSY